MPFLPGALLPPRRINAREHTKLLQTLVLNWLFAGSPGSLAWCFRRSQPGRTNGRLRPIPGRHAKAARAMGNRCPLSHVPRPGVYRCCICVWTNYRVSFSSGRYLFPLRNPVFFRWALRVCPHPYPVPCFDRPRWRPGFHLGLASVGILPSSFVARVNSAKKRPRHKVSAESGLSQSTRID